jgi:hypothetical protein
MYSDFSQFDGLSPVGLMFIAPIFLLSMTPAAHHGVQWPWRSNRFSHCSHHGLLTEQASNWPHWVGLFYTIAIPYLKPSQRRTNTMINKLVSLHLP